MKMIEEYAPFQGAAVRSSCPNNNFTPYDVLKSFRDYEKQRRMARATDYVMSAHEDGSVFCHNTEDCRFSTLYSFDEIFERLSRDSYGRHKPLWKRIYLNWA